MARIRSKSTGRTPSPSDSSPSPLSPLSPSPPLRAVDLTTLPPSPPALPPFPDASDTSGSGSRSSSPSESTAPTSTQPSPTSSQRTGQTQSTRNVRKSMTAWSRSALRCASGSLWGASSFRSCWSVPFPLLFLSPLSLSLSPFPTSSCCGPLTLVISPLAAALLRGLEMPQSHSLEGYCLRLHQHPSQPLLLHPSVPLLFLLHSQPFFHRTLTSGFVFP